MRHFLTLEQVLAIHVVGIDEFGGAHGVRDHGLLEAAVARPQSGYYNDVFEEAAALWESLSQNHPFIDGNKRVGFGATDVFLRLNGFKIGARDDAIYAFIIGLYDSGTFKFDNLLQWLRDSTTPVDPI